MTDFFWRFGCEILYFLQVVHEIVCGGVLDDLDVNCFRCCPAAWLAWNLWIARGEELWSLFACVSEASELAKAPGPPYGPSLQTRVLLMLQCILKSAKRIAIFPKITRMCAE